MLLVVISYQDCIRGRLSKCVRVSMFKCAAIQSLLSPLQNPMCPSSIKTKWDHCDYWVGAPHHARNELICAAALISTLCTKMDMPQNELWSFQSYARVALAKCQTGQRLQTKIEISLRYPHFALDKLCVEHDAKLHAYAETTVAKRPGDWQFLLRHLVVVSCGNNN